MSFFGNGAINRANLHAGVQQMAEGVGGAFLLAFLIRAGVSIPLVFCTQAAFSIGRFAVRPVVLPLARRLGLRRTAMVGTVMDAGVYLLLPSVHGFGGAWLLMIAVGGLGSAVYWTSFHAYFATLGDAEHRGSQLGAREALSALVRVLAPAAGGLGLAAFGSTATFWAAAAIQVAAALPLMGGPEIAVADEAPGGFRAAGWGAAIFAVDGWWSGTAFFVWQVVLFVSLSEQYVAYGGAMAIAGLLAAVGSLGVGRLVDLGHGGRSAALAYALGGAGVILKAVGYQTPWVAVIANAVGAFTFTLIMPVLMAPVYNLAKRSPCPLRFHMATEGGWDLGLALAMLSAAALTWAGAPFAAPLLLALLAAVGATVLLVRRYGDSAY